MDATLKKNFYLNFLKTFLSVLIPFITYPYAARILLPSGIGKVDFVMSVISYFQLLASLGISTYAITEGSKLKDNKCEFEEFAMEIFNINFLSTLLSYLFLCFLIMSKRMEAYNTLLLITSTSIFFNLIGLNWIFYVFEDFKYITIRTILFQIIALALLIILVRSPDDIIPYTMLTIFSTVGSNVLNFFYVKKYVCLRFMILKPCAVKQHIKPILTLFFASATSSIYLNFDKTMLGIMSNDISVGLYGLSVKIVSVVLVLIIALRDVFLPRISYYIAKSDDKRVRELITNGLSLIYLITIPSAIGIFTMSENLILLIGSEAYIGANSSLKVLALKLIFAPINAFLAYQVLIPQRKENIVSYVTACGAIVNILFNVMFIKYLAILGVAIASVLSEISIFCLLLKFVTPYLSWQIIYLQLFQFTISASSIILIYLCIGMYFTGHSLLLISSLLSVLFYFTLLFCFKNKTLLDIINIK